jgi:hypothetical protein
MKINQAKLSGFGAHHRTVWPSWLSPCNCKLPGPPLKRSDSDWVEKSVRYWVEKTSSRRERERERENFFYTKRMCVFWTRFSSTLCLLAYSSESKCFLNWNWEVGVESGWFLFGLGFGYCGWSLLARPTNFVFNN